MYELVEFHKKIDEFAEKGISIIGISYDSIAVLKKFSDKHQISYPLLSDVDSKVITKFGIINTGIDSTKSYYGLPYPGIYIIDADYKVVDKQFEKSYAERPSAEAVLINHFDKEHTSNVEYFKTDYLTGKIALSDTTAHRAQILTMQIKINLSDDFHLYGTPIPEGYIPLSIEIEPNPNFTMDEIIYTETTQLKLHGLNEIFNILPNKISVKTNIRIIKKPQKGKNTVIINVKFQACDKKTCKPPEKFKIEFPLEIL